MEDSNLKLPKQRAEEMIKKFSKLVGPELAKACALLSCEIILKDVGAKDWGKDGMTGGNYWKQVRKELL